MRFDFRERRHLTLRPLVTVLINNYNYGRFLREAIDSALNQTYGNVEVVVVDDGSTDESRDIIDGYAGRIVSVLKKNGGQGSAFNAGIAASRGESSACWTRTIPLTFAKSKSGSLLPARHNAVSPLARGAGWERHPA